MHSRLKHREALLPAHVAALSRGRIAVVSVDQRALGRRGDGLVESDLGRYDLLADFRRVRVVDDGHRQVAKGADVRADVLVRRAHHLVGAAEHVTASGNDRCALLGADVWVGGGF